MACRYHVVATAHASCEQLLPMGHESTERSTLGNCLKAMTRIHKAMLAVKTRVSSSGAESDVHLDGSDVVDGGCAGVGHCQDGICARDEIPVHPAIFVTHVDGVV